jgi:uncharacterized membrane protein
LKQNSRRSRLSKRRYGMGCSTSSPRYARVLIVIGVIVVVVVIAAVVIVTTIASTSVIVLTTVIILIIIVAIVYAPKCVQLLRRLMLLDTPRGIRGSWSLDIRHARASSLVAVLLLTLREWLLMRSHGLHVVGCIGEHGCCSAWRSCSSRRSHRHANRPR